MEQRGGESGTSEGNTEGKRIIQIRQSISGVCTRLSKKRGAMRHFDQFVLEEFAKNFQITRKAYLEGDTDTVKKFFELYV